MVFNSLQFVVFFVVVYALYRLLPHRAQNWMLVGASYYFYAAWDWRFLSLLVGSTVVDFFVGRYLGAVTDPRRRRLALVLSLLFNLGMIGVFKAEDIRAIVGDDKRISRVLQRLVREKRLERERPTSKTYRVAPPKIIPRLDWTG